MTEVRENWKTERQKSKFKNKIPEVQFCWMGVGVKPMCYAGLLLWDSEGPVLGFTILLMAGYTFPVNSWA